MGLHHGGEPPEWLDGEVAFVICPICRAHVPLNEVAPTQQPQGDATGPTARRR